MQGVGISIVLNYLPVYIGSIVSLILDITDTLE